MHYAIIVVVVFVDTKHFDLSKDIKECLYDVPLETCQDFFLQTIQMSQENNKILMRKMSLSKK
jgi:hypothetical protein